MSEKRPNLFIVGAPRCGTSSLHNYLDQHPQVFMSAVKEPHFFSKDMNRAYEDYQGRKLPTLFKDLKQYLALFSQAGEEKILGESSVYYLYSEVAPDEIYRFNSDARIIIMLREPVAFLQSLHSRLRFMGDEDCRSFVRALELEEPRRNGRNLPRTVRLPFLLHYSKFVRFTEHIERYRSRFLDEQMRFIVFDDFCTNTEKVYDGVLDFLGVERMNPPKIAAINSNVEPRSTRLAAFLSSRRIAWPPPAGAPEGKAPYGRRWRNLPLRVKSKLFRALERLNARRVVRQSLDLDEDRREELMKRFKPEVDRISRLLDRDLVALWGYDRIG